MWRAALFALVCAPLAAFADAAYDEAEVVDVEPIVEATDRVEPEPRCWSEAADRPAPAESAAKPLLGALVGGAIGNAIGHNKRNKQVGAVIGALLGGAVVADATRRDQAPAARQVCVERTRRVERIAGYMVTYRYRGKTYRARMDERPGATIRVRVSVSPA